MLELVDLEYNCADLTGEKWLCPVSFVSSCPASVLCEKYQNKKRCILELGGGLSSAGCEHLEA